MNVKEYIESGILEAYVLDTLSQPEREEVQLNLSLYPELIAELNTIEAAMLQFAHANAVTPPDYLEQQIWNTIEAQNPQAQIPNSQFPIPDLATAPKTIPLAPAPREVSWQRAAIWVALASSVLTNFVLLGQRNEAKTQKLSIESRVDSLTTQQQQLASLVGRYKKASDMLADTAMQAIVMHTMQPGHPMAATIYWSKAKAEAYIAIEKLPMPPKGMQYQMWVIQNGKPVDMGVLPNELIASTGMSKLQMRVSEGQAFAISLEKEGGNPTPTSVYVLGKVSI